MKPHKILTVVLGAALLMTLTGCDRSAQELEKTKADLASAQAELATMKANVAKIDANLAETIEERDSLKNALEKANASQNNSEKQNDVEYLKRGQLVKRILFDESANNSKKGPHTLNYYPVVIDFDSGRTYIPFIEYKMKGYKGLFKTEGLAAWLKDNEFDAMAAPGEGYRGLGGCDMSILPTRKDTIDYFKKEKKENKDEDNKFYEAQIELLKKVKWGGSL